MKLPFKVKRGFDGHRETTLLDYPDLVTQLGAELAESATLPAMMSKYPDLAKLIKQYPIASEIPLGEKARRKMQKNSRKLKAALRQLTMAEVRTHSCLGESTNSVNQINS